MICWRHDLRRLVPPNQRNWHCVRLTAHRFPPAEMADSRGGIIAVMTDITQILSRIELGDPSAAEQLLPLVYEELRGLAAAKLSHEKPGQTLQATGLVHEAYLRLVGKESGRHWDGRGHFFCAAAEAMRRILINRARDKQRLKRGGDRQRVDLDQLAVIDDATDEDLLVIDEALEQLERENKRCAELVKLRFFAGMTLEEAATTLGVARRTADRDWAFARAWLFNVLTRDEEAI